MEIILRNDYNSGINLFNVVSITKKNNDLSPSMFGTLTYNLDYCFAFSNYFKVLIIGTLRHIWKLLQFRPPVLLVKFIKSEIIHSPAFSNDSLFLFIRFYVFDNDFFENRA